MTIPSPADCASWFATQFDRGAVVLSDPAAGVALESVNGRDLDPATTMRWISRPLGDGARLLVLEASGAVTAVLHVGADQLTGDVTLLALGEDDPEPSEQLRALGIPSTTTDDGAVAHQDALASSLRFAVVTEGQAPGIPDSPPMKPQEELPLDITDSRFIALADPNFGAPLEAIWHIMWELAGVRWCLLNGGLDVDDVERIPYRQALRADDFVRALHRCIDAGLSHLQLPVYVTTGRGRGHTIHLRAFEADDVVYHDPWPGRSLLAEGNNHMNVRARPQPDARLWRVTTDEFTRVAYASLVEPAVWLPICGVKAELALADLRTSKLIGSFRFHETGRFPDEDEAGVTRIAMEPGNWQEHISLVLTVDADQNVHATQLLVDRSWIDDPATAPFAADLLKSYVRAVVPEADSDDVELLVRALAELTTGRFVEILSAGPPHLLDHYRMLCLTVRGAAPFARAMLLCSKINAYNVTDDSGRQQLALVVSRARGELGALIEDHTTGYFMDEYRDYLWRLTQRRLERLGSVPTTQSAE